MRKSPKQNYIFFLFPLFATKLDITISELFSIDTNPDSTFLKRFHSILPNLASIACPPTIPQDQLCQYFLTTLSPKRARARFREATAIYQLNDLYETFSKDMADHTHLLPSILSPTTSYPIAGMSRLQLSHRLPPIPFALNMRRKLRLPILPYEFKCQCNNTYDIYGDHPHFPVQPGEVTNKQTTEPYRQQLNSK